MFPGFYTDEEGFSTYFVDLKGYLWKLYPNLCNLGYKALPHVKLFKLRREENINNLISDFNDFPHVVNWASQKSGFFEGYDDDYGFSVFYVNSRKETWIILTTGMGNDPIERNGLPENSVERTGDVYNLLLNRLPFNYTIAIS